MKPVLIAPSILSADFSRLGEEIAAVDKAAPRSQVISLMTREGHSRVPVFGDTLDDAEDHGTDSTFHGVNGAQSICVAGLGALTERTAPCEFGDNGGTLVAQQSKCKSTLDSVRIGALREVNENAEIEVDVFEGGTLIAVRVQEADAEETRTSITTMRQYVGAGDFGGAHSSPLRQRQ